VLGRDNQPGRYAAIKARGLGEDLPLVEKAVAIDLLSPMQASGGWISDKAEGFAITADGRIFAVTDNDGVNDASGETLLVQLGSKDAP
jgi:hypothetical protein